MRKKRVNVCGLILLTLLTGIYAQETVPAAAGNASGSGGSVSYSVGQVVYTTNTGTTGSVEQGVQQPYVISVVPVIEPTKGIDLNYLAYPNPTNGFLILKTDEQNLNQNSKQLFAYQLYDVNGNLLENKKIETSEMSIDLSGLIPATYILKVTQDKQEIKVFKIIKN